MITLHARISLICIFLILLLLLLGLSKPEHFGCNERREEGGSPPHLKERRDKDYGDGWLTDQFGLVRSPGEERE